MAVAPRELCEGAWRGLPGGGVPGRRPSRNDLPGMGKGPVGGEGTLRGDFRGCLGPWRREVPSPRTLKVSSGLGSYIPDVCGICSQQTLGKVYKECKAGRHQIAKNMLIRAMPKAIGCIQI